MSNILRKLIDHLQWADARILDALRRAEPAPGKALELFGHVLGSEHVWLSRVKGETAKLAVWPVLDVESAAGVAAANADASRELIDAANDESLQRLIHYRNSAGVEFDSTVEDILTHVAMHGQYHRGQVNAILRDAGLEPAPVDYIAFVRGAAAATRS